MTVAEDAVGADCLIRRLKESRPDLDGVVGVDFSQTAASVFDALRAAFPGCSFKDAGPMLRGLRLVKLPEEIDRIEMACRQVDTGIIGAIILPTFLAGLLGRFIPNVVVHNLVESVIKLLIFFGYLLLCSKQKDIQRVFQYHGAEHKTIFCYEAGLPLTVENCRIQPRHHPRCGTSFLFVVVVVSILVSSVVFSFVDWRNVWVRTGLHLLLLIPVVGVTYEFNRYVGGHDNPVTNALAKPGLWLQNFTTNEPDDSMLEVAIRALELVIPEEKGKDAW